MASSLDDMESYELLQIELDRSLKQFLLNLPEALNNNAQVQHFLNSWIEYICFVRHLWVWEEIVKEDTNEAFFNWYKEISQEILPLDLLKNFHSFYKTA